MPHPARFAVLLAIACMPAMAGGTLGMDELGPLLRQRPTQMAEVQAAYQLSDSAFAEISLGSHFTHLSGLRVGPYTVRLHRRTAQEPRKRELLICTQAHYLDSRGRELREEAIFQAVRVKETIATLLVRDIDAPGGCTAPRVTG